MNFYQFLCVLLIFGFEGGMWDLIALIPDHCFSVNFGGISCQMLRSFILIRYRSS